jgi:hypothetical protein
MKTLITLLLASVGIASAQTNTNSVTVFISFTNTVGEYITNAEVVSLAPNKLVYRANGGLSGGTIRLEKLPPDLQAKFNYDPDEANKADQIENDKRAADLQKRIAAQQALDEIEQDKIQRTNNAVLIADIINDSIRAKAQREWPDDYDMQVYEIKKQVAACKWIYQTQYIIGVPLETFRAIKSKAADEWPDDYDMQKYEIEKQVKAYKQLQ